MRFSQVGKLTNSENLKFEHHHRHRREGRHHLQLVNRMTRR